MKTLPEARQTLFRRGKPEFRFITLEDLPWLWAAYKLQADSVMSKEEFKEWMSEELEQFDRIYMVEDRNYRFSGGKGPVGMFLCHFDGWNMEPHTEFFPWATPRNKMMAIAGFLMYLRHQKGIGCIRIFCGDESRELFKRLRKYVPIKVGGKIYSGRPKGDDYIFYVVGKRPVRA